MVMWIFHVIFAKTGESRINFYLHSGWLPSFWNFSYSFSLICLLMWMMLRNFFSLFIWKVVILSKCSLNLVVSLKVVGESWLVLQWIQLYIVLLCIFYSSVCIFRLISVVFLYKTKVWYYVLIGFFLWNAWFWQCERCVGKLDFYIISSM